MEEEPRFSSKTSRRDALKKIGVGSALIWSAPALSSLGQAMAQVGGESPATARCAEDGQCSAQFCNGSTLCGTGGPFGQCLCTQTTEGECFCAEDVVCTGTNDCNSSTDCQSGEKCMPVCCTGLNQCMPTCSVTTQGARITGDVKRASDPPG